MTVAATVTETAYQLVGASLGPFNTVFPYAADTDVEAWLDQGGGAGPTRVGIGDWTLVDAGPLPGPGNASLSAALLPGAGIWADGARLVLRRWTPRAQPSAFGEAAGFDPAACEAALDNIARQVQDESDKIQRAFISPLGEPGLVLPDLTLRIGGYLGFDGAGAPIVTPFIEAAQAIGPAPFTLLNGPTTLIPGRRYYIDSSAGSFGVNLPAFANADLLSPIEIFSGDFAAANPVTFTSADVDISIQGQLGTAFELNTNQTGLTVIAYNGLWRVLRMTA